MAGWKSDKSGLGVAFGHHGEFVQGLFTSKEGKACRGLVTVPCNLFASKAHFRPRWGAPLRVEPSDKLKARAAAELALQRMGAERLGGVIQVSNNIPTGWGLGSSTSDIVATVRAISGALGCVLAADRIGAIAVAAETASDSTMFDREDLLFAQRGGYVIEKLSGSLPVLEVLGFNTGCSSSGIDTLRLPLPDYTDQEIQTFHRIMSELRRAVVEGDRKLVGLTATISAQINDSYLPKPQFALINSIAEKIGALGVQVAHSGTVMGMLFDPSDCDLVLKTAKAREMLSNLRIGPIWRFTTARSNGDDVPIDCLSKRADDDLSFYQV